MTSRLLAAFSIPKQARFESQLRYCEGTVRFRGRLLYFDSR
nr:MAG TPA: hypothetical protein [Caudoviricetes sp.]